MEKYLCGLGQLFMTIFLHNYSSFMVIPAIVDVTMSALCPGKDECSLAIYLTGFSQAVINNIHDHLPFKFLYLTFLYISYYYYAWSFSLLYELVTINNLLVLIWKYCPYVILHWKPCVETSHLEVCLLIVFFPFGENFIAC